MDLFALGTPVIDLFAKVGRKELSALGLLEGSTNYFSAGELARIERRLGKRIMHRYAGDNARNVCEGFAALGGWCGLQGTVGSDADGSYFKANLLQCGIASFVRERKGSTGKVIALVAPDGQRTFCADLGASGGCSRRERDAFSDSRIFFVTSITLCIGKPVSGLAMRYLGECGKRKKTVALALENAPMVAHHRKFLLSAVKKYAGVLFMNEEEARALLGKGAEKRLPRLKPKIPIYLKRGAGGSWLYLHGRRHEIPAMPAEVIDTTGAGDAYAAGALYGLSRGYTHLGSAKLGCVVATRVVQELGAGIPQAHTRIRIRHKKR